MMRYCGRPNTSGVLTQNCVAQEGHAGKHRDINGRRWDESDEIVTFLNARLDEDERAADVKPGGDAAVRTLAVQHDGEAVVVWDPERIRLDVAAKRLIIADYLSSPQPNMYLVLCRLANVYYRHPDWDEGWLIA